NRPDKSLGKRVQIRTPGGQPDDFHSTVSHKMPEGAGVERVSIEDQAPDVAEEAIVRIGEIPRHLSHPDVVRLTREAGDLDGPRLELDDEDDDVANHRSEER